MILPVFEPLVPVVLAVTGVILAAAGLLIIAGRRRRGFIAVGTFVLVAGVAMISPSATTNTTQTVVSATSEAISELTDRTRTDPVPDPERGEIIAVETPAAP